MSCRRPMSGFPEGMSRGNVAEEKLTSPSVLRNLLASFGLKPRKSLGQNFLVDRNILREILDNADLTSSDLVLEVGSGVGTVTRELADGAGGVVAVEIDRNLTGVLRETLAGHENVFLWQGDILKANIPELLEEGSSRLKLAGWVPKLVSNLPYHITSPVFSRLFGTEVRWERLVVTVQKEVATRMVAPPGGKEFGPFSLFIQFYSRPKIVRAIPPSAFYPQPKVESAIVVMIPRETLPFDHPNLFFSVVRAAFSRRRKTLKNNLAGSALVGRTRRSAAEIILRAGLNPAARAETLSLEDFVALSRQFLASQEDGDSSK